MVTGFTSKRGDQKSEKSEDVEIDDVSKIQA